MKAKEKAVRDAAAALAVALAEAKEAGLVVTWPARPDGLNSIEISETAKSHPTVTVNGAHPEVADKATAAAQAAVHKAVETPPKK